MRHLLAFVALLACHAAFSAELFGTVDALSGAATVADQSGKSTAVAVGMNIYEGQTINSGTDGEVHLVTEDGGIIAVRPNTTFRVDEYKAEGSSGDKMFMSLLRGTIRSITGWVGKFDHSAYRINTPTATIGIRGTDHETTVIEKGNGDEAGTYDNVNEGATVMKTPHGTADVTPGKYAFAPKGRAVAPQILAQRPHFLAERRLRIEERIQQRKETLHNRLNQMRDERINKVKSIQGNRLSPVGERSVNAREQQHGQAAERRNELREQRMKQAGMQQQERRNRIDRGNQQNAGDRKERIRQRREAMRKNDSAEGEERRVSEQRRHRK